MFSGKFVKTDGYQRVPYNTVNSENGNSLIT